MRCDECGAEEGKAYESYNGFTFCLTAGVFPDCRFKFEGKLWEKARKEANRAAAEKIAKTGSSPEALVERERIQREAINLRDL